MKASSGADNSASASLHIPRRFVGGSGGTHTATAVPAAALACELAGIVLDHVGGVSGGAITTALLAGGMSPAQLVSMVVEHDTASLFERTGTFEDLILAQLPPSWTKVKRPRRPIHEGIIRSDPLGQALDEHVPVWPRHFWTMAVPQFIDKDLRREYPGHYFALFSSDGTTLIDVGTGEKRIFSETPPPVGLAVRASCAIPGLIQAVEYEGMRLFDGCLSLYGTCPTGLLREYFNISSNDIVAIDLHETPSRQMKFIMGLGRMFIGHHPRGWKPLPRDKEIIIYPKVEGISSVQFELTREQRTVLVMVGFRAAVYRLSGAGLLTGDKLELATEAAQSYDALYDLLIDGTVPDDQIGNRLL